MSDSLITIIAIFVAVMLLFLFPLMQLLGGNDEISQTAIQTATINFVDESRTIGKITWENYDKLVKAVAATGHSADVDLEIKVKDENPGKKTAWTSGSVLGENVYYSVYTSQILDQMEEGGEDGVYEMNEGDILIANVKITDVTLAQSLRGMFYSITGSGAPEISASHSGVVSANSKDD